MILIILILIPTLLITLKTIEKFERFNNLISKILTILFRVLTPIIIVYGLYNLITNWKDYDQKNIKESIIIVFLASILAVLFERLIKRIESKKDSKTKNDK